MLISVCIHTCNGRFTYIITISSYIHINTYVYIHDYTFVFLINDSPITDLNSSKLQAPDTSQAQNFVFLALQYFFSYSNLL